MATPLNLRQRRRVRGDDSDSSFSEEPSRGSSSDELQDEEDLLGAIEPYRFEPSDSGSAAEGLLALKLTRKRTGHSIVCHNGK